VLEHGLRFDEQFSFDFYDMDFCRQVEARGLTMSTGDLSVVHESGGHFGTSDWGKAYQAYLNKWENSPQMNK